MKKMKNNYDSVWKTQQKLVLTKSQNRLNEKKIRQRKTENRLKRRTKSIKRSKGYITPKDTLPL